MAALGTPLAEGIQMGLVHSAQAPRTMQKPEGTGAPDRALSPLEVLALFCQAPAAFECLPTKKGMDLIEETTNLYRATGAFMREKNPETTQALLTGINETKLDISILYFAARLWGNPEIGMQVKEELESSSPTSKGGTLLLTLLKPLNVQKSLSFWASLGEAPPRPVRRAVLASKPAPAGKARIAIKSPQLRIVK